MKRTLLSIVCVTLISLSSFSQTWIPEGAGFSTLSRGIMNISIVNNQIVWASAYDGTGGTNGAQDFTKTINGGTTWTSGKVNNATGLQTSMLFALDANTAWANMYKASGSNPQGVYKTTDGGTTWTHQATALFTNTSSFPDWIWFWDANTGTAVGDPINGHFEIYTTTDGGTTWVAIPTSQSPVALSGEYGYTSNVCVHGNYVWFGTNHGRVFASTDKGHNWIVAAPYTTAQNAFPAYKDSLNGIGMKYMAARDTLALLKSSTDGGVTYSALTYHGTVYNDEMHFIPNSSNTYVSTGVDTNYQPNRFGFTYSFDGGQTWATEPTIQGTQITCSQWLNDSTGWLGSFNTSTTDGLYKFHGVLAQPVSAFISPDTLLVLGGQAHFTNESTGNPTSYAWTFTGGTPASSTLKTPPAITYNASGTYNVKLVVTNGFGSNTLTKTGYIHVGGVGINELNQNSVSVYPNPVTDRVTVKSNNNIKQVQIFNITGQVVFDQIIDAKIITISINGLNAGVYTLKAITDNGTVTRKIVVQ